MHKFEPKKFKIKATQEIIVRCGVCKKESHPVNRTNATLRIRNISVYDLTMILEMLEEASDGVGIQTFTTQETQA